MTLTLLQWKATMEGLIGGVQAEMGAGIPPKTRAAIDTFRERLEENLSGRGRKRFEQELEAFLQSNRSLRAASKRYLDKKIRLAVKAAIVELKRMRRLLAQRKRPRDS